MIVRFGIASNPTGDKHINTDVCTDVWLTQRCINLHLCNWIYNEWVLQSGWRRWHRLVWYVQASAKVLSHSKVFLYHLCFSIAMCRRVSYDTVLARFWNLVSLYIPQVGGGTDCNGISPFYLLHKYHFKRVTRHQKIRRYGFHTATALNTHTELNHLHVAEGFNITFPPILLWRIYNWFIIFQSQ